MYGSSEENVTCLRESTNVQKEARYLMHISKMWSHSRAAINIIFP